MGVFCVCYICICLLINYLISMQPDDDDEAVEVEEDSGKYS